MNGAPSPAAELARASARLHSALPLAIALADTVEELRVALRAQAVAVARTTPEPGQLLYVAAAGPGAAELRGARVSSAIGLMSGTIAAPDLTLTPDVRRDQERLPLLDQLAQARARALMLAPLTVAGQVIGVLQVLNPVGRSAFGSEDRPRLAAFAALVAIALVQRGEHRQAGLDIEALAELELRRRCAAWSLPSEGFLDQLCALGETDAPMILQGEPGSGRERAARALAAWLGARAPETGAAFVLADAPDVALAANEWSGDPTAMAALSRLAPAGGTLYLLDLGAVPAPLAAPLAALLGALRRPGAAGGAVRIMAAVDAVTTSVPSASDVPVELRRFFGDAELKMPALASRPEDFAAITGELVRGLRAPLDSRALGFEPAAWEQLAAEPWPRNIDSLRQRVAALILASDVPWIGADQVAEQMALAGPPIGRGGNGDSRRMERALAATDPSARAAALRRLEMSGRAVPPAVLPPFLALLEDPLDWLRIHTARILAAHPERRALGPLASRLDREADPTVRRELLTALGRLETPAAAPPLLPHLSDADPDVRAAALLALGRIGGEGARKAAASLAADPDPRVRATALGAAFLIGPAEAQTASSGVAVRLVIVPPGGRGEPEFRPLTGESLSIGRTPQNDLSLPDPAVSKRHATLLRNGEDWMVRDDGSTNGTRVNGIRVAERTLEAGDDIGIGTFVLRFEVEARRPLPAPAAIANDLESTLFRMAAALVAPGVTPPPAKAVVPRAGASVERLLDETRGADREARRWAARVLGDLGQGVQRLIELAASDPDPEVRLEATRALGRTRAPEAVPPLRDKLADRWLRIAAIEALGTLRAPAAVDPLLELLHAERSSRVRRAVVRALGHIGEERATKVLAELTRAPAIGADVLAALAQIGGPRATTALIAHLEVGDPLCAEALRGIASLKVPEAIPELIALLGADDVLLAQRAEEALVAIGTSAVKPLMAAITGLDERGHAMRALAAIGDPDAATVLLPLAPRSMEARMALRRMGRQALPELFGALDGAPGRTSRLLASLRESEAEAVVSHMIERLIADRRESDAPPRWLESVLVVFSAQSIELLRKLIREAPAPIRRRAFHVLRRIGNSGAAAAIPEILAAFDAPEAPEAVAIEALRAAAWVADGEVGAAIRRRWPELGPAARAAAVAPLVAAAEGRGGKAAQQALAAALADSDPAVRSAAVLAAAGLPEPFAETILTSLKEDPDGRVKAIAAALLQHDQRSQLDESRAERVHEEAIGRRLREQLAQNEQELSAQLLWELDHLTDGDRTELLLDALLELRERAE